MLNKMTWFFVVTAALLAGCSSSSNDSVVTEPGDNLVSGNAITVPASINAAARAYQFDYAMTSVNNEETTARALLFEPPIDAPTDGYPLVVWAHGTTGIANACAPSLSFDDLSNDIAINALLGAGYAIVAPDYEGFGTPGIHPYYVRSSHAKSVLAAVPAAHRVEGSNLSDDWAIVGHSQGGHVALAAARAEQHPAYILQAVAALAPGTDLKEVSDSVFDAIDQELAAGQFQVAADRAFYLNVYGAYVAHAVALVDTTFDPASIFGSTIGPLINTAVTETRCGDYAASVSTALTQHFAGGGTVGDFGGLSRLWYEQPTIAARLSDEALGDEAQSMPLLVVQGTADRQIPVAATTAFVDRQRSLGTDITYELLEGARHGDVARDEFSRTITWLAEHFPPQ